MKNLWLFNQRRLKIIEALIDCRKIGGCDLKSRLSAKGPILAYHLSILRKKGIIREEKIGRSKNYFLTESGFVLAKKILKIIK